MYSNVLLPFKLAALNSNLSGRYSKVNYCMYSFGYFPGVRLWFADVSEPSISSIFKGWM